MASSVSSMFDALKAARSVVSKVEAAKQLGDLLQEACRTGGLEDARTRALLCDLLQRAVDLAKSEEAGCRHAAATIVGLAAQVATSASDHPASDLASLLTYSGTGADAGSAELLSLEAFDLGTVLARGEPLLAHNPARYAVEADNKGLGAKSSLNPAQRLLLQRAEVLRVLGLSAHGTSGSAGAPVAQRDVTTDTDGAAAQAALAVTDFRGLLDEKDLAVSSLSGSSTATGRAKGGSDARALLPVPGPAARGNRPQMADTAGASSTADSDSAAATSSTTAPSSASAAAPAPSASGNVSVEPPPALEAVADCYHLLCYRAFDVDWEVRHGAVLCLHELLAGLQRSGGQSQQPSNSSNVGAGSSTLTEGMDGTATDAGQVADALVVQDAVLRCVALLALDKVGDYTSPGDDDVALRPPAVSGDGAGAASSSSGGANGPRQASGAKAPAASAYPASRTAIGTRAPVREAAADVLRLAAGQLPATALQVVVHHLGPLATHADWSTRHGAALGILATLPAAAGELAASHVEGVGPMLLALLQDGLGPGAAFVVDARTKAKPKKGAAASNKAQPAEETIVQPSEDVSAVAAAAVTRLYDMAGSAACSPPVRAAVLSCLQPSSVLAVCGRLLSLAADPASGLTAAVLPCNLAALDLHSSTMQSGTVDTDTAGASSAAAAKVKGTNGPAPFADATHLSLDLPSLAVHVASFVRHPSSAVRLAATGALDRILDMCDIGSSANTASVQQGSLSKPKKSRQDTGRSASLAQSGAAQVHLPSTSTSTPTSITRVCLAAAYRCALLEEGGRGMARVIEPDGTSVGLSSSAGQSAALPLGPAGPRPTPQTTRAATSTSTAPTIREPSAENIMTTPMEPYGPFSAWLTVAAPTIPREDWTGSAAGAQDRATVHTVPVGLERCLTPIELAAVRLFQKAAMRLHTVAASDVQPSSRATASDTSASYEDTDSSWTTLGPWLSAAHAVACTVDGELICGTAVEPGCIQLILGNDLEDDDGDDRSMAMDEAGVQSGSSSGPTSAQARGAVPATPQDVSPMTMFKRALAARLLAELLCGETEASRLNTSGSSTSTRVAHSSPSSAGLAAAHTLGLLQAGLEQRSVPMLQYAALLAVSACSLSGPAAAAVATVCNPGLRDGLAMFPLTLPIPTNNTDGLGAAAATSSSDADAAGVATADVSAMRPYLRMLHAACCDLHAVLDTAGLLPAQLKGDAGGLHDADMATEAVTVHAEQGRPQRKAAGKAGRPQRRATTDVDMATRPSDDAEAVSAGAVGMGMPSLILDPTVSPAAAQALLDVLQPLLASHVPNGAHDDGAGGGASGSARPSKRAKQVKTETTVPDLTAIVGHEEIVFQAERVRALLQLVRDKWSVTARVTAGLVAAAMLCPAAVTGDAWLLPDKLTAPLRALAEFCCPAPQSQGSSSASGSSRPGESVAAADAASPVTCDDVNSWAQATACRVMATLLATFLTHAVSNAGAKAGLDLLKIADRLWSNVLGCVTSEGTDIGAAHRGMAWLMAALADQITALGQEASALLQQKLIAIIQQHEHTSVGCLLCAAIVGHAQGELLSTVRAQLMSVVSIGTAQQILTYLAHDLHHTAAVLVDVFARLRSAVPGASITVPTGHGATAAGSGQTTGAGAAAATPGMGASVTIPANELRQRLLEGLAGLLSSTDAWARVGSDGPSGQDGASSNAAGSSSIGGTPDIVPIQTAMERYGPVFAPLVVGCLAHPEPGVRSAATAAFRGLVMFLPLHGRLEIQQGVLAAWPPALRTAHDEGVGILTFLTRGAWAGLARLPLSLAQAVEGSDGGRAQGQNTEASGRSTSAAASAAADQAASSPDQALSLPFALPQGVHLRPYQVEGITWLNFLRRNNLAGILADDMGLGKTLQTLCAIALYANDVRTQTGPQPVVSAGVGSSSAETTGTSSVQPAAAAHTVSLVACPSSLCHHWLNEMGRFFGTPGGAQDGHGHGEHRSSGSGAGTSSTPSYPGQVHVPLLRGVILEGDAEQRLAILQSALQVQGGSTPSVTAASATAGASGSHIGQGTSHVVLIVSHGTLRKDADMLSQHLKGRLAFLVVDESHLACNADSGLARAIRTVAAVAAHRLALTGTPIQNGVQELHTVFDWLLPGYLGDASSFRRTVSNVVQRARGPNATAADVTAANTALRGLHKSLLPFILRRLKGDVLKELPPRTIIDVPVELSSLQRRLYDVFVSRTGTVWAQAAVRSLIEEQVLEGGGADGGDAGSAGAAASTSSASSAVATSAPVPAGPIPDAGPKLPVNALTAITTLRQICCHPYLVTDKALLEEIDVEQETDNPAPSKQTSAERGALACYVDNKPFPVHMSCKLVGLYQLVQQLGVASPSVVETDDREDEQDAGAHNGASGAASSAAAPGADSGAAAGGRKRRRQVEHAPSVGLTSAATPSDNMESAGDTPQHPPTPTSAAAPSLTSFTADARKVLVFSQSTRMLDAVEQGLLRGGSGQHAGLSGLRYSRMDGSTPPHARAALASEFNRDPSIRLLLLTTGVGGLGLSLVGADTVIFLDHDWNPSRDLQAMDRAHRLGQTRPVTVYRLLARDTLEERIMGVQRFKIQVAGAVVATGAAASAGAGSAMPGPTHAVLDRFAGHGNGHAHSARSAAGAGGDADEDAQLATALTGRGKARGGSSRGRT